MSFRFIFLFLCLQVSISNKILSNLSLLFEDSNDCGTWQKKYAQLHTDILQKNIPPKYLISIAGRCGVADNLSGLITQFLLALLTNRAFLRFSFDELIRLEDVYTSPYINWSSPTLPNRLYGCMTAPYGPQKDEWCRRLQRNPPKWPLMSLKTYPMHLTEYDHEMFLNSNLKSYPIGKRGVPVLLVAGHKGRVWKTFTNTHHKTQLHEMGLHQENAFSCFYNYLFRLRSHICVESCQYISQQLLTLSASRVVIIGIQIRVGDTVFENDKNTPFSSGSAHFQCADDIAHSLAPHVSVKYYLVSDSLQLKREARKHYGERIITDISTPVVHTDCNNKADNCSISLVRRALSHSVSDLHLFSLAHIHIVTVNSGFGVLGAMMRNTKYHLLYSIDIVKKEKRHCRIGNEDDLNVLLMQWTGI
mmetsp:Transcript_3272/g.3443  ORF Transcript_3272/g.3443 Transcript_3272/m.3443 type:complete len:418 (+) Transcript_3272:218-1471(+)